MGPRPCPPPARSAYRAAAPRTCAERSVRPFRGPGPQARSHNLALRQPGIAATRGSRPQKPPAHAAHRARPARATLGAVRVPKPPGDRVGHAPAEAARAEAALLARERHDLGVAAASANEVQAAFLEDAALQVLLELLDDNLRQPARLLHPLAKQRPALGHRLVEHRLFRAPSCVAIPAANAGSSCRACAG